MSKNILRRIAKCQAIGLCCLVNSMSEAVWAQSVISDGRQSFSADYFTPYAPRTLQDMLDNVPNFTIQSAEDERGLGQGGLNVLINGQLLIGKGQDPLNQLSLIPASSVKSINLLDAASLNIPGLRGLVANVITSGGTFSGTWKWEPQWRARNDAVLYQGAIAVTGERSGVQYSLAVNSDMVRQGFYGPEELLDDRFRVFETRYEELEVSGEQPRLTGTLAWAPAPGHLLNLKGIFQALNFQRQQRTYSEALTDRGLTAYGLGVFSDDQRLGKVDISYQFPVFIGQMKLIGLYSQNNRKLKTQSDLEKLDGTEISKIIFLDDNKAQELVLRSEFDWTQSAGSSWQIAAETAYNKLDVDSLLLRGIGDDDLVPVPRPDAKARVEEYRGEISLSHNRALTDNISLQGSIGAELSRLETGETQREYFRPKGFLQTSYRPSIGQTWDFRIAREVGQISFRDFISSVSLLEGTSQIGNVDLVPSQSWIFDGGYDYRFTNGHALSLGLTHEMIDDLVDRIPIGDVGDAVGNIDSAQRTTFSVGTTLKGEPYGVKGLQIDLKGKLRTSNLKDPIEGFDRQINGMDRLALSAKFRHDVTNSPWAYGGFVSYQDVTPTYQSRQIVYAKKRPFETSYIFIEHKNIKGLTVQLRLSELLETESFYARDIFQGRRDGGIIDRYERRKRDLDGPYLQLSVTGSF